MTAELALNIITLDKIDHMFQKMCLVNYRVTWLFEWHFGQFLPQPRCLHNIFSPHFHYIYTTFTLHEIFTTSFHYIFTTNLHHRGTSRQGWTDSMGMHTQIFTINLHHRFSTQVFTTRFHHKFSPWIFTMTFTLQIYTTNLNHSVNSAKIKNSQNAVVVSLFWWSDSYL